MGPGVGAGDDVGDRGRKRVTAEVSHVYFYSAACLCVKESQLNRHIIPLFFHINRSEITSTVKGFFPSSRQLHDSWPYEKLEKTKQTPLQSATKKKTLRIIKCKSLEYILQRWYYSSSSYLKFVSTSNFLI